MTDFSLMKIIVVEDDPLSSKLITGLLESNGLLNITSTDSGEACLDLLKTDIPDIALIDIGLPGISGLEVCKILRSRKETQHIPIIIITGGPLPLAEAVSKSFEAGATDFIPKPIEAAPFLARVKSALNIKKYQDRLNKELSRRKQMEKIIRDKESQLRQAQKMQAVGTLAGGIAHDFNNLLYIISGNTEILMDNETNGNTLLLKEILKSTQRGADLVKQLLTFSHKAEVNLLPTSLNAGIKRLKKMIERIFPKMIDIRLALDENLDLINADKSQIEQVLINLCLNARDAMKDQGRLTIMTKNIINNENTFINNFTKEDGPWIELSVSDTGTGMDMETQERIFDPFFTTKEIGKGTGLGLSVIYGIIKAHKGFIFCESKLNTGTTFNLYFPAAEKLAGADIPNISKGLAGGLLKGNETILIADDEKSVLEITQAIVELLGYHTITADNGESALRIFSKKHNEIDLVLLDLGMPGMGGKKCLEKLIGRKPDVKVVIASGYSEHGLIKDAMDYGAKASVIKPYTMNEISKVLRDVLDG